VGCAVELDEIWSFVGAKATERWLWHALAHHTGSVLAYVVGTWKDREFLQLRTLLAPFGITRYDTDTAGVYRRHLPPEQHTVGKLTMQKIERKHLTLRTRLKRLARKTLCFPVRLSCTTSTSGYIWTVLNSAVRYKKNTYQIGTLPTLRLRSCR
jgi:insertion element IS1 protein InsB